MPAAAPAVDLGTRDQERIVARGAERVRERLVETRPAGAAVVFRVRREQRQRAAGAGEDALALFVVERARSRLFGAMQAKHVKLRPRQEAAPFGIRPLDLELPSPRWCRRSTKARRRRERGTTRIKLRAVDHGHDPGFAPQLFEPGVASQLNR